MVGSGGPWNINIHYDRLLAEICRPGERVLDVGCGEGFLSSRLAGLGCDVVAMDRDRDVLERARRRWAGRQVRWLHADVLDGTIDGVECGFDVVVSNATLHHLPDTAVALQRLSDLLQPGGRLGVVGFARNDFSDWPRSLIGAVGKFVMNRVMGKWEHSAPTSWPPPLSYGQVRRLSHQVLPGCRYRRLWLGRYFLTRSKPVAEA